MNRCAFSAEIILPSPLVIAKRLCYVSGIEALRLTNGRETEMAKRTPSKGYEVARELAKQLAAMDEAERNALSAQILQPVTIEGRAVSLKNTMLVFAQRQGATVIGGFKQWLKAGRVVRKGEGALWIYAPSVRKVELDDGAEAEETRFRLVPVFDVSQTEELEQEAQAA